MKKFKDFWDKKQSEFKFKKAGSGYRLSDSTTSGSQSTSSRLVNEHPLPPPPSSVGRRTGPDANVAAAALSRIQGVGSVNRPPTKTTLHEIMTEEKKKINDEMKLKQEMEERKAQQDAQLKESQKNPFKEFENSQLFTCPFLEITTPLPFTELMHKMKASIYDNFADDAILRSAMCLFNCNRTVDNSQDEQLEVCLNILKKVITNLKNANLDELNKFKRISKAKIERKVLSVQGALDFLFAIGFTIDSDTGEWLVYVEPDEEIPQKMQYILELLESPQVIPIELDRQVRQLTNENTTIELSGENDLRLTSADVKKFQTNLTKQREINEMLVSKETKARLLSSTYSRPCVFCKLRFKFSVADNGIETVEAVFYSKETLLEVRDWFLGSFGGLFEGKDVHFKNGADTFDTQCLTKTLVDLQLTPAATLHVLAK